LPSCKEDAKSKRLLHITITIRSRVVIEEIGSIWQTPAIAGDFQRIFCNRVQVISGYLQRYNALDMEVALGKGKNNLSIPFLSGPCCSCDGSSDWFFVT
jgi:hypothetical protein